MTKDFKLAAALIISTSLISLLSYHSVDNQVTAEDKQYIQLYLNGITPLDIKPSYLQQLHFIKAVQQSVLTRAAIDEGIALNRGREPKDLYLAEKGLCYDRSRVIEKILQNAGFETRHLAIYSTVKTGSVLKSLLTPQVSSHAVTEVLTKQGWLVIDSNSGWVSINLDSQPVSIANIHANTTSLTSIPWEKNPPSNIYTEPFTYVIGLYSRHGYFYPPYNFVPDLNYSELLQNWF